MAFQDVELYLKELIGLLHARSTSLDSPCQHFSAASLAVLPKSSSHWNTLENHSINSSLAFFFPLKRYAPNRPLSEFPRYTMDTAILRLDLESP